MISNRISFAYDAPNSSCLSSAQIQTHTDRYSSSELVFFQSFTPDGNTTLCLCWLRSTPWYFVEKSGGKPSACSCCCRSCLVGCIFADEWKVMGKVEKRGLQSLGTVSWPILAASILVPQPWEFLLLRWRSGSRLPGSLASFWQRLLKPWLTRML